MLDEESSKKIIEEAKALAPEIYKDAAKPIIQEVGNVTGRTVKALLSPIRGMLWGWERIEEFVEESVKRRLEKVSEEKRKSPEPEIAVPLIQALTYTAHNETLREMYINLLANSMDTDKDKVVHPSFVDLIKQMNSLDAKVFDQLAKSTAYQKVVNPKIMLKGQGKFLTNRTPEWFIGFTITGYNEFDISASLVRLSKFGLIDLMYDRTTIGESYDHLKNSKYLLDVLDFSKKAQPTSELEISCTESVLFVNEYGRQFASACK